MNDDQNNNNQNPATQDVTEEVAVGEPQTQAPSEEPAADETSITVDVEGENVPDSAEGVTIETDQVEGEPHHPVEPNPDEIPPLDEPEIEPVDQMKSDEDQNISEPVESENQETVESAPEAVTEEVEAGETQGGEETPDDQTEAPQAAPIPTQSETPGKWYVVHVFAGHENKVLTTLKQRIEAEHLEGKIFDILVPTQDKIEIRSGKKETVKEKIFPGYILVRMILDDESWLAVRTTQGVTSFIGAGNKPIPISDKEVSTIVNYTSQGAQPTFKDVFLVDDTVKIVDGPFADFIGKVDSVDKEKGRVRVLVSIFGRETPVELDFLQVQKL